MKTKTARRIEELQALIEGERLVLDRCYLQYCESKSNIEKWQKELDALMNSSPLLNWRSTHVY